MEKLQSNDVMIFNSKKSYEILQDMIKSYKDILTPETIEYLYSLIGLEISALKNISIEKMKKLMKIDIYRLAAYYNIYHKSINLIQQKAQEIGLKILIYNSSDERLYNIFIDGLIPDMQRKFMILHYFFSSNDELKVNLCEKSNDSVIHEQRISDLEATITKLETDFRNADDERMGYILDAIETHKRKLEELKNMHITSEGLYQSEIQQSFSSLLLDELGIKDIDLKLEQKEKNPYRDAIDMTSNYIKKYPNITIIKTVS